MRQLKQRRGDEMDSTKVPRGGDSIRRAKRWLMRAGAATMAFALAGTLGWVDMQPASAATVYEIDGEWQEPVTSPVASGETLVSIWRFNINDDAAAPGNEPVDNVTVTFNVQNGRFTEVPSICLTDGVDPVSEISEDGSALTCNL